MRFNSLDGKIRSVDLNKINACRNVRASKIQNNVYNILEGIYGSHAILQDFIIPGTKLSVDFFIPSFSLVIEVDGNQHDKFNSFFHNSRKDLIKQQGRDDNKEKWCQINNLIIVRVKEKDKVTKNSLISMIVEAIRKQSE